VKLGEIEPAAASAQLRPAEERARRTYDRLGKALQVARRFRRERNAAAAKARGLAGIIEDRCNSAIEREEASWDVN
jgi:hypothetical protein